MAMMRFADQHKDDEEYCIAWLPDGKSFVIRNPDSFTRQVLPKYFKATKFQSFTRKLYRWGFRQVNRGIGPDDPIIFGNEFFLRDDEETMVRMRSVTAAAARKRQGGGVGSRKRSLVELDEERKLILLDRLMQEQAAMAGGDASFMGNMGPYMPPVGFPMMQHSFGGFPPHMMPPQHFMMMQQQAQIQQQAQMQQQAQIQQQALQEQDGGVGGSSSGKPPAAASEQDIVNASVNALRYAS